MRVKQGDPVQPQRVHSSKSPLGRRTRRLAISSRENDRYSIISGLGQTACIVPPFAPERRSRWRSWLLCLEAAERALKAGLVESTCECRQLAPRRLVFTHSKGTLDANSSAALLRWFGIRPSVLSGA